MVHSGWYGCLLNRSQSKTGLVETHFIILSEAGASWWEQNKHCFYTHGSWKSLLHGSPDTTDKTVTQLCETKKNRQDIPNFVSKCRNNATTHSQKGREVSWESIVSSTVCRCIFLLQIVRGLHKASCYYYVQSFSEIDTSCQSHVISTSLWMKYFLYEVYEIGLQSFLESWLAFSQVGNRYCRNP